MYGMSKLEIKQETNKRTLKTEGKPKRTTTGHVGAPAYDREPIIEAVLETIATGKSLVTAAHQQGITYTCWMNWLAEDTALVDRYARAREAQADYLADELMDISDDKSGDYVLRDGQTIVDSEAIARSRLRVDTRKWIASKLKPKKYGDKITNELTGKDGKDLVFGLKDVSVDRAKDILTEALTNLAK